MQCSVTVQQCLHSYSDLTNKLKEGNKIKYINITISSKHIQYINPNMYIHHHSTNIYKYITVNGWMYVSSMCVCMRVCVICIACIINCIGIVATLQQRCALYEIDIRKLDSMRGSSQLDFRHERQPQYY